MPVIRESQELSLSSSSKVELELCETQESVRDILSNLVSANSLLSDEANSFSKKNIILKSDEIVKKYDFWPLGNSKDFTYLSSVISIEEFSKHPDKYFTKLTKWFWSFPLDFNLKELSKKFIGTMGFDFEDWLISFQQSVLFWHWDLADSLSKALRDIWVNQAWTDWYIKIDILSYLKNYEAFVDFVNWEIDDEDNKEHALNSLKLIKIFCNSIFSTVTNISVVEPNIFFAEELISHEESKNIQREWSKKIDEINPFKPNNIDEQQAFIEIEKLLLSTAKWQTNREINELLKVQNPEEFFKLVDLIVNTLFSDKKFSKYWFQKDDKLLDDFAIDELIAFSSFISRYIIEEYEKPDTWVENILKWFSTSSLSWKCTDFTGMSLHILNHYFKEKYPEKFENIYIWYDSQVIWNSYRHSYIKVFWYDKNWKIKATFIDPTKLSGNKLEDLLFASDIYDSINWSNLPLQITRSAEDLIISKVNKERQNQSIEKSKINLLERLKNTYNYIKINWFYDYMVKVWKEDKLLL